MTIALTNELLRKVKLRGPAAHGSDLSSSAFLSWVVLPAPRADPLALGDDKKGSTSLIFQLPIALPIDVIKILFS